MINVEVKHDVNLGKAAGVMVILGVTVGTTIVLTKEVVEYGKTKLKEIKNKKVNK